MNYLRIALNNAQFPFKYEERQVPALLPGMDTANRAPAAFTGSAGNMDWNIPQVIHMENYLPTARGYVGVGWHTYGNNVYGNVADYLNTTTNFDSDTLGGWAGSGFTLNSNPYNRVQEFSTVAVYVNSAPTYADVLPQESEYLYFAAGTVISYSLQFVTIGSDALPYLAFKSTLGTTPSSVGQLPGVFNGYCYSGSYTILTSGYYSPYFYVPANSTLQLSSLYITSGTGLASRPDAIFRSTLGLMLRRGSNVYLQSGSGWQTTPSYADSNRPTSTATINGVIYNYSSPGSLGSATIPRVGVTPQTVIYPNQYPNMALQTILQCAGYLVGYQGTTIFWSTPSNPLDFNGYGSGYASPSGIEGLITTIVPILQGYVVFTSTNAVLATYTNIPNAPFRFQVIPNAGGVVGDYPVSGDPQSQEIYAYTSQGFQVITATGQCQTIPQVTDFISAGQFTQMKPNGSLVRMRKLIVPVVTDSPVMVSYVGARYVVISYRSQSLPWYTHALVLDLTNQRWGHIRVAHTLVVEIDGVITTTSDLIWARLGLVSPAGTILSPVNPSEYIQYPGGGSITGPEKIIGQFSGLVVGPISLTRQSKLTVQEVEISSLETSLPLVVKGYFNMSGEVTEGASVATFTDYTALRSGLTRKFVGRATADNVELSIQGLANLQNLTIGVTKHGK